MAANYMTPMSSTMASPRAAPDSARHHHPAAGTPFESLSASMRLIRRMATEQFERDQLALTDFWALSWIADGMTSPTHLGRVLALTPAGMTQLLDRLEQRELIGRTRNPGDRRATVLVLTPAGRELLRRSRDRYSRFLHELAAELSPAGREGLRVVSRELAEVLRRRQTSASLAE